MPTLENDKHEFFCHEYIKNLNITQSYLLVYPESSYESARRSGSRLLSQDDIKQRVKELRDERAERCKVTAADLIASTLEVRERCLQAEPVYVMVNGRKQETGEYQFKENAVLKANELIAKLNGLLTQKHEVETSQKPEKLEDFLRRKKMEKEAEKQLQEEENGES